MSRSRHRLPAILTKQKNGPIRTFVCLNLIRNLINKNSRNPPKLNNFEPELFAGGVCFGVPPKEEEPGAGEVGVPRLPLLSFFPPLNLIFLYFTFHFKLITNFTYSWSPMNWPIGFGIALDPLWQPKIALKN